MKKRLVVLTLFLLCCFASLLVHYYKIQVVEGEVWSRQARRQHFFEIAEPFQRGTFFSNTSLLSTHPEIPQRLVFDIQKFHLYADPEAIPESQREKVVENLGLSDSESKFVAEQLAMKSRNRRLLMWLNKEQKEAILKWWYPFCREHKIAKNALYFVNDFQRSYPFGKLLGQVLHTVQGVKDETTKQAIPTGGVELSLNAHLKGHEGKRLLMRSPRNAFETGEVITSPENGASVYLTINHILQAIAEEELEKGVKKAKAKGGWAVMMNPKTGEVLCLAQYPYFYPEDYQAYFNDSEMIDNTKVKAVSDANEPGSIMKALTMAIALQANKELEKKGEKPLFDPEEKLATYNIPFPGRKKIIKDVSCHKFLNMNMAIQRSSNVYPARLVDLVIQKFGSDWYRNFLIENFGLGKKTEIELPAESPGVVPKPGRYHKNGTPEWSTATPFSMAFGHNMQVNSLQIARAFSVFANGGYLVQPTLVRKIVKEDGEVVLDHTKAGPFPRVLEEDVVERVIQAMKYVTKPGSSGHRANVWGYTEAGKSGTPNKIENGKYSETKYCVSFVGFTPLKNPAFVLLVTIDEPEYDPIRKRHHGGPCCGPIFREIAKRSLEYLGVVPDDPHGYPANDPRYDFEKADWRKEAMALQEMYKKWNN